MSDATKMAEELDSLLLKTLQEYNAGKEGVEINAALVRIARDRVRDLKVSVNADQDTPARRLMEEARLRLAGGDLPELDTETPDAATA